MQFVHPDFKGENPGHYSPAVKVGNLMFVSGQLSIDPDTREVCRGDIKDHARLALKDGGQLLLEQASYAVLSCLFHVLSVLLLLYCECKVTQTCRKMGYPEVLN